MSEENGYVHIETDEIGISTITFFHPQSNSLPSFLLNKLAQSIEYAGKDNRLSDLFNQVAIGLFAGASFDELQSIQNLEEGIAFFSDLRK